MDELIKTLNEAYNLMRMIPVSDTAVDTMYFTRLKMQQAYQLAEKLKGEMQNERKEENENADGGSAGSGHI